MGRPPCRDKVGIKKGSRWTRQEDIILTSYVQELVPEDWDSVPRNTGLLRSSESCKHRWMKYLRPGVNRENFTPREEEIISSMQAQIGNKWASIALFLPQRTNVDIKYHWNYHLKKIKTFQSGLDPKMATSSDSSTDQFVSNSFSGPKSSTTFDITTTSTTDHHHASSTILNLNQSCSTPTSYALSAENISRLLEGWMRSSPKTEKFHQNNNSTLEKFSTSGTSKGNTAHHFGSNEELESILSFHNMSNIAWDKSSCDSDHQQQKENFVHDRKERSENEPPLSFIENWLLEDNENWLLEDNGGQVEELMELPRIF